MDLSVGRIVWARRQKTDIYWPGKITIISNNTNEFWSTDLQYNYFVQFFVTNQSFWMTDVLPYRQYRDSMTNDSFMHYGLHPTIRQDFLNAITQADYASSNEMYTSHHHLTTIPTTKPTLIPITEDNTDNDFLLTPAPILPSNTEYYNPSYQSTSNRIIQSMDTCPANMNEETQGTTVNNDWYTQQGLIVESITPPLPSQNDMQSRYTSTADNIQKTYSIIIITTKTYSNPSFISFLFNSLSHFIHHSIIYIDDDDHPLPINNYHHPPASTISYLLCLDHFDSHIRQTLDSAILNHLNSHTNYLFLLLNVPSHDLVQHFYAKVVNQRTIVVLHYHSTFEDEALLLCSGDRRTFEEIRLNLLTYLCSKMKYIESRGDGDEQLYSADCISSMIQTSNVLNHFVQKQIQETINTTFDSNFLENNQSVINELFPRLSIHQPSHSHTALDFVHQSNEELLQNSSKQSTMINDLFQNGAIQTHVPPPICEYYLKNILDEN